MHQKLQRRKSFEKRARISAFQLQNASGENYRRDSCIFFSMMWQKGYR